MKTYQVEVCADTNDADYIYQTTEFAEDAEFEGWQGTKLSMVYFIRRVCAEIKKIEGHNWVCHDYAGDEAPSKMYKGKLAQDEIDGFSDFVPRGENGVHTIQSVRITLVDIINTEQIYP